MRFIFISFTLILLLPFGKRGWTQDVYISEPISLRASVGYDLISPRQGGLLLLKNNLTTFQVIGFDEGMKKAWEKELELDRRRPQIVRTISHQDGFSLLYVYRKEGSAHLKVHRYNAAANLTDSLTIADLSGTIYEYNMQTALSEDRNKLLIYQQKFQGRIEAMTFDLEQMKMLWTWETTIEELSQQRFFSDMLLDNDGNAYLLVEENNRKSKLDHHRLLIFRFGPATNQQKVRYAIPMPGYLHNSQYYRFDNLNWQLTGGGLYASENINRTAGSFYFSLPFEAGGDQSEATLQYTPYPEELLSKLSNRSNPQKDLAYAKTKHIILRQDGGALIICERSHLFERNHGINTPASPRFADRFATDYYFDEVFTLSYAPDGRLEWFNVLHKKQYSQNDEGAFSSYFPATTTARVLLLFNDEIRYENTVSAYEIVSTGRARRRTLFNTQHLQLQLRFTHSLQISAREIVIPSEKRNVLKLVKVVL